MCSALKEGVIGWSPSKETNLILHEMQQTCDNKENQEEDETATLLPGYDLFSKGLDLQNGMKDFLKGYPDPEKMGGQIERNVEEGNELIMEAAKLGLKGAQYATALNYLSGGFYHTNEEDSMKEVHKWIELAAKNGHAEAQVTYGQKLWIEGLNGSHPIDKEKGLFWLRKALAQVLLMGAILIQLGMHWVKSRLGVLSIVQHVLHGNCSYSRQVRFMQMVRIMMNCYMFALIVEWEPHC